jgi:hypothetical protein
MDETEYEMSHCRIVCMSSKAQEKWDKAEPAVKNCTLAILDQQARKITEKIMKEMENENGDK